MDLSRLSSFDEEEDDCDLRATSKIETYTISYFSQEVINITPWFEIDKSKQILPTEKKMTQTLATHGVLLDKNNETEGFETENKDSFCAVTFDHSDAIYEKSAYTRTMKILSVMANHTAVKIFFCRKILLRYLKYKSLECGFILLFY